MGEIIKGFLPFGEYKPDLRYLINDGLLTADGVVPVYGNYISSPLLSRIVEVGQGTAQGLHCHLQNGNSYVLIAEAANAHIYQVTTAGVVSDVSRGAFYTLPAGVFGGATGCSFGTNVVMTNLIDAVQFQAAGAGAFANMITSTFAPKALFCFPLRSNLFLARCDLAAPYDTLAAGANENLVAWSRNEDIRQFGSPNTNPEIIGSDYQLLNFDIGDIRAGLAGADYGIIGCSNGIARIDGPPYTFRVIARNIGLAFPYGACAVRGDIYFMTEAGLARLPGGEGPVEIIGVGKWVRSLVDNVTGFGAHPASVPVSVSAAGSSLALTAFQSLSMTYDPINDLIYLAYTMSNDGSNISRGVLVYNIGEDRASFFKLINPEADPASVQFLRVGRQSDVASWSPGRDVRFIERAPVAVGLPHVYFCKMVLGNSGMDAVLQKGYIQFKPGYTTRITKLRPVYSVTDQAAIERIDATIQCTNKPHGTPVSYGPYSAANAMGWIVTPTTDFYDFHSPKFTMTSNANMHKVVEYEGFEYEVEIGAPYAA